MKGWNYSKLTEVAKIYGGPEKLLKHVETKGILKGLAIASVIAATIIKVNSAANTDPKKDQ